MIQYLYILIHFFIFIYQIYSYSSHNNEIKRNPIVFFHIRKCGGWTIHNYYSSKLQTQFGNSCQQKNIKNDWRCTIGFMSNTSIEKQCEGYQQLYNSTDEFSQVEQPLLKNQIFPSYITFLTVLRHPIERVISSYRMTRNTYPKEDDWNLKDWLLQTKMKSLPIRDGTNFSIH